MTQNKAKNKFTGMDDFKQKFSETKLSGYIWMIEEQEPTVYTTATIDFSKLNKTANPFNKIQEAYLTDGKQSIHIKTIDGVEKVFVLAYKDFEDTSIYQMKEVNYPSHLKKIEKLFFKQVSELTDNKISVGFQTWQPIVKLFIKLTPKTN